MGRGWLMSDPSPSPVFAELQITHMQNAAEKHVAFPGAGSSHNRNNLGTVFRTAASDKDVAEFSEGNRLSGISRIHDHGNAGVAREEISGERARIAEAQPSSPTFFCG